VPPSTPISLQNGRSCTSAATVKLERWRPRRRYYLMSGLYRRFGTYCRALGLAVSIRDHHTASIAPNHSRFWLSHLGEPEMTAEKESWRCSSLVLNIFLFQPSAPIQLGSLRPPALDVPRLARFAFCSPPSHSSRSSTRLLACSDGFRYRSGSLPLLLTLRCPT